MTPQPTASPIRIGWSQQDITPSRPVFLSGQFHARVSEGVADPIYATAMAIDNGQDHVIFISLDLVGFQDDAVSLISQKLADVEGLDGRKIVVNATHTHAAPETRIYNPAAGVTAGPPGIDLGIEVMSAQEYIEFFTTQAANAAREAWEKRAPGSLAYGLAHAVIGRNRRWVNRDGVSKMYGNTAVPEFDHIDGYEDPSINILAAWDTSGKLTGVLVNAACPSQASENDWSITADFWHDTRQEIRRRLGAHVHILGQCSAAGDQSPRPIWGKAAEERMLKLKGRNQRQEIAHRLANAVDEVLPIIKPVAEREMVLRHLIQYVEVPYNQLSQKDVDDALASAADHMKKYEALKAEIEANPTLRQQPRWYREVSMHHRRALWYRSVAVRYENLKTTPNYSARLHAVRLGNMALVSNPFEYYLDYGVRIKARSPFEQTFIVQITGRGTYVSTPRSIAGGGYGSFPASNIIGPTGGDILCEKSLEMLAQLRD